MVARASLKAKVTYPAWPGVRYAVAFIDGPNERYLEEWNIGIGIVGGAMKTLLTEVGGFLESAA